MRKYYFAGLFSGIVVSSFLFYVFQYQSSQNSALFNKSRTINQYSHSSGNIKTKNPDNQHIESTEEKNATKQGVTIPNSLAVILFEDSVDLQSLKLSEIVALQLHITPQENDLISNLIKNSIVELGQIESQSAKLEETVQGMAYVIDQNPKADELQKSFSSKLFSIFPENRSKADLVASYITNSKVFGGFGLFKKEIYVTDYATSNVDGSDGPMKSMVEVELTTESSSSRVSTRSHTIDPSLEFVKIRYPFLK